MRRFLLLLFVGWAAAQNSGDLRLVQNGLTNSSYTSGRLEIYLFGVWGTICDDNWDSFNTAVACRQLGHELPSSSIITYTTSSAGGFGSAPAGRRIWLSNVNCIGSESRLTRCLSDLPYGVNNCFHYEDVAVYCNTDDVPPNAVGIAVGVSIAAVVVFVLILVIAGVVIFCLFARGAKSSFRP